VNILIFGGTTEGRTLAEALSRRQIPCTVCVATEYGEQVMEPSEHIQVRQGRLSPDQMTELIASGGYTAVVDATHPFAALVSENICASVGDLPLIRYQRCLEHTESSCCRYFDSVEQCAAALTETEGTVFLTTGSKDLNVYCRQEGLKQRLIVRVLPALESLQLCYDAGLEGKQILAMQGPFSQKMNQTQISEYGIKVLVTKESGRTGGLDEKMMAAEAEHIACFVIRPPQPQKPTREHSETYSTAGSVEDVFAALGLPSDTQTAGDTSHIILAGIGMGNPDTMTLAVRSAVTDADIIFGAPRMLESVRHLTSAQMIPSYLPKDIVPAITRLTADGPRKIIVLFSGDTGFYSGAAKLQDALRPLSNLQVSLEPGISSIQYLASRTGISWQDACIISTHGIPEQQWLPELQSAIESHRKIFFLTSGLQDVQRIASLVPSEWQLAVGYQLSYPDEQIMTLTPADCASLTASGLYCGFIIPTQKVVQ